MERLSGTSFVWRFLLYIFTLGLAGFFFLSFQLTQEVLPPGDGVQGEVIVEIPPGASSAEVAHILEEEGLVRNQLAFRLYANYVGYGHRLQAGRYQLTPDLTLKEVAEKMVRGEVMVDYIEVTIPEGLHKEQIGLRLENHELTTLDSFLKATREESFDFWFIQEQEGEKTSLEGYLFPDTYRIKMEADDIEIISLLLGRFQEVVEYSDREKAQEKGMTFHQVVTLASIIEREARVKKEQPMISAVFHQRLEKGMPLQSCATVQYALGEVKPELSYQDLKVDSPYNTYLHYGLPPGPIASPGKDALRAALYPEENDYLYFVLKGDGSGEHYFSRTLEEHLRYQEKANRERAGR